MAAPVVRAMPVTPAAAERSSGSTTAMTYDWRVGTSIWLRLKRSSRTATASWQGRHQRHEDQQHVRRDVGEDHRVDQPDPRGDPGRRQRRHGRQQVGGEEDRAEDRRLDAELDVEPVGHQALRDEPATEGVDREQDRQLEHDALRAPEAEPAADAVGRRPSRAAPRWPCRAARTRSPSAMPDDRVADDDRAVGVERGDAAVEQGLAEQPGAERAGRGRDVADEVVPGEGRGPAPVRRRSG